MEIIRPKLMSFRVTGLHGENLNPPNGKIESSFQLAQTIEIGFGLAMIPVRRVQVIIKIDFDAQTACQGAMEKTEKGVAKFKAGYEAKFDYAEEVTEEQVEPLMAQDSYQYGLVSQVFPLAMTHFRRELQSLGIDARELPLGL
jgi:hypothetical protein